MIVDIPPSDLSSLINFGRRIHCEWSQADTALQHRMSLFQVTTFIATLLTSWTLIIFLDLPVCFPLGMTLLLHSVSMFDSWEQLCVRWLGVWAAPLKVGTLWWLDSWLPCSVKDSNTCPRGVLVASNTPEMMTTVWSGRTITFHRGPFPMRTRVNYRRRLFVWSWRDAFLRRRPMEAEVKRCRATFSERLWPDVWWSLIADESNNKHFQSRRS